MTILLFLAAAAPVRAAAQEPVPISRSDLLRMLGGDTYAPGEVARMIRRACLDFRPTDDDLRRYRELGATDEVVSALAGCRDAVDAPPDAEPPVTLFLPDSVTARVGDTVRIRGRVERSGEAAADVPVVLETGSASSSSGRYLTAAMSEDDGTIVFRVPAGFRARRVDVRPRTASATLAGSSGVELIVRPGPLRWVDVQPEELPAGPDRPEDLAVRVGLRDAHGNGLPGVGIVLAPEARSGGSSLARGVTGPDGEARLSLPGGALVGVERLGVWASDSVLTWIPVRRAAPDGASRRAGGR